MNLEQQIKHHVAKAMETLYAASIAETSVALNETLKEYEGDITVVVFPLVRFSKKKPEETGTEIGEFLKENIDDVVGFNVVKGFLNLVIADSYWKSFLAENKHNVCFGKGNSNKTVVLEYCGPNTNKPLHLGHIRNMLLGYGTAELLTFAGNKVHKVNIYNDRGIAICKSMLAWQKYADGETPESAGMKSDHFVGKYYVEFDKHYKKEVQTLVDSGKSKEEAEKESPLLQEAREMLLKWEAGDEEVLALWNKMNNWCYAGFQETFDALGVDFEKHYKESDYYERGKELILQGVKEKDFYQKEDGSVWVNLEDKGLDHKLLLRSDGTSVYITQDIGIAEARYKDYHFNNSVYVVADEQNYHFKVLKLVLEKMGKSYADGIYHLSYGLVNLPDGRMKSREGTVVDADDLIQEMIDTAAKHTNELGKVDDFTAEEAQELYQTLALGALKYFILKVNPKKSMIFNPEESIDFQGNTGPFIQFNYVRIQSLLRKQTIAAYDLAELSLAPEEKELLKAAYKFPQLINQAATAYDVSMVAAYSYDLAKLFSKFYASTSILKVEDENLKNFRLDLSNFVGKILENCFSILGITMPKRM